MVATPDGDRLVMNEGVIFTYGDALLRLGRVPANEPIVVSRDTRTAGATTRATDGGIFNYGHAGFHGLVRFHRAQQARRRVAAG